MRTPCGAARFRDDREIIPSPGNDSHGRRDGSDARGGGGTILRAEVDALIGLQSVSS